MASAPTEPVDITGAMVEAAPLGDWLTIAPVALCLTFAALLLMVRDDPRRGGLIAAAGLAALVVVDIALLARVVEGGPLTMVMGRWLPPFGIAFTVDTLGAVFALATALVASAAAVFAAAEMGEREIRYGFWSFLFLLVGGVTGAFTTGDIFNLYVWFEVLLIASFGLLILGSDTEQIDGATKYTFLNLVATTLFLAATAFLYGVTGTLNMADLAAKLPVIAAASPAPLVTIGALFLFAFAMKAAAFPVNFWLPASYHTPRVVVSALFAGLLTKVGLYALLRIVVMIMPAARDELGLLIAWVAGLTMVFGALGALAQSDMRRLMGFLVVSGIGVMLAGLAIATPLALSGTVFYALHSIVVMTALYMATGIAGRLAGGFSLHEMGGLYRRSAPLAALSLVLFFAVAGLPPFTGFWPKAALVGASIEIGAGWLAAAILLNGFLTTIAVGRVFALAYWRPAPERMSVPERGRLGDPDHHTDPDRAPTDRAVSAEGEAAFAAARRAARAHKLAERDLPAWREMVPLGALTALVVGFGLFPNGAFTLAVDAGTGLLDPAPYYESVFGVAEITGGEDRLTPETLRDAVDAGTVRVPDAAVRVPEAAVRVPEVAQ